MRAIDARALHGDTSDVPSVANAFLAFGHATGEHSTIRNDDVTVLAPGSTLGAAFPRHWVWAPGTITRNGCALDVPHPAGALGARITRIREVLPVVIEDPLEQAIVAHLATPVGIRRRVRARGRRAVPRVARDVRVVATALGAGVVERLERLADVVDLVLVFAFLTDGTTRIRRRDWLKTFDRRAAHSVTVHSTVDTGAGSTRVEWVEERDIILDGLSGVAATKTVITTVLQSGRGASIRWAWAFFTSNYPLYTAAFLTVIFRMGEYFVVVIEAIVEAALFRVETNGTADVVHCFRV